MTLPLLETSSSPAVRSHVVRPRDLPRQPIDGLYVHVPFCFHKCHYCDFYSITRQSRARMSQFVDLVLREAELWTTPNAPLFRPATVFFGGGTPTLLPIDEMRRLIDGLRARIDLSNVNEWTSEANPATVDLDYCQMLREAGLDRISFGAQSFDRNELATLERHHKPDDVAASVELARQAGFQRINVDLIYAIPGQSQESWLRSLEDAISINTKHLSCYGLTYEPNTPIAVRKRLGTLRAAPEELELGMMRHARRRLSEAGLPAYEISNYAAPGEECRHNLMYWTGGSYVGLGPSAASHAHGHRFRNRPHLREWEQSIERSELPAIDYEVLSPQQRAGELVMLMLRLSRGVEFSDFTNRTAGLDARSFFAEKLDRLHKTGLLVIDEFHFALSEAGVQVADAIASEFLVVD